MPTPTDHWNHIYTAKATDRVSWYAPHLERSLALIDGLNLAPDAPIIDVGAGASTLVDDLLARGQRDLTVVDLAEVALQHARLRLGPQAAQVTWLTGDITQIQLPRRHFAVWHDRAVFHFLTDPADRQRYVAQCRQAVRPGGHVLVATFGLEGPERCSDLTVAHYDADGLHEAFGAGFEKIASITETHLTPWGSAQEFVYCLCRTGS